MPNTTVREVGAQSLKKGCWRRGVLHPDRILHGTAARMVAPISTRAGSRTSLRADDTPRYRFLRLRGSDQTAENGPMEKNLSDIELLKHPGRTTPEARTTSSHGCVRGNQAVLFPNEKDRARHPVVNRTHFQGSGTRSTIDSEFIQNEFGSILSE